MGVTFSLTIKQKMGQSSDRMANMPVYRIHNPDDTVRSPYKRIMQDRVIAAQMTSPMPSSGSIQAEHADDDDTCDALQGHSYIKLY